MVWEDVHNADDALDGHQFDFIADFHEGWLLDQCDEFLTESLMRKLIQTRFRGHCQHVAQCRDAFKLEHDVL